MRCILTVTLLAGSASLFAADDKKKAEPAPIKVVALDRKLHAHRTGALAQELRLDTERSRLLENGLGAAGFHPLLHSTGGEADEPGRSTPHAVGPT